jgi:hypothetical protein
MKCEWHPERPGSPVKVNVGKGVGLYRSINCAECIDSMRSKGFNPRPDIKGR